MTTLLALDTTLGACSVALIENGVVVAQKKEVRARGHVERLLPMVEEIINTAKISMADITTIAVTIGPGTFAGVRIGLSAAKGMAMALDIPLITVTSLESLTYEFAKKNANFAGNVAVAIDARRGELYFQVFKIIDENIQAISQEEALPIPLAAKKINTNIKMIIGSGAKILNSALDGQKIDFSTDFQNPTAEFIAELSLNYGKRRLDVDHVKPLYLRAPDAKMPSKNVITKIKND